MGADGSTILLLLLLSSWGGVCGITGYLIGKKGREL